jgi:hypothetical protein
MGFADGCPGRFLELWCLTILYLGANPSHMAVDVNGLACSLHHPTVYNHQKGGQSFLTSTAPSCHVAVSSGILPGDAKHLGLDILCVVDHSGTCKAESYLEKPAFT